MISFIASHAFLFFTVIVIALMAGFAIFWRRRLSFFEKDINQAAQDQREADRQKARVVEHDSP